jgi:hypothetical protein
VYVLLSQGYGVFQKARVRFEAGVVLAALVLIFVAPYTLWRHFIHPLRKMQSQAQTGMASPAFIATLMMIALILLVGATTYHVVIGY